MNENRTYGIELEFACSISHLELTTLINDTFAAEGFDHKAKNGFGYYHNTDSSNRKVWDIKSDSSIQSPDVCERYPYGIEIASPILSGTEGFASLKIITDILSKVAKVGKTTGFHVHHGVRAKELSAIAKSWPKVENEVYLMVPPSRRENRYCRKWGCSFSEGNIRSWYRRNIRSRYVGLNLESYWVRGTVEFRLAAGTVEYDKIVNWVIYTQLLLENANAISNAPEANIHIDNLNLILQGLKKTQKESRPQALKRKMRTLSTLDELLNDEELLTVYNNKKCWIKNDFAKLSENFQNNLSDDVINAINWSVKRYNKFSSQTI